MKAIVRSDDGALSRKERIDILFKEYDSLRTEIQAFASRQHGLILVVGTSVGLSLQVGEHHAEWKVGLLIGLVLSAVLFLYYDQCVRRCARRISAIEQRVNEIAGEELLEWDSRWGVATVSPRSYFSFRRRSEASPQAKRSR